MRKIKVTLKRSLSGRTDRQRRTVEALGLGRLDSYRVHDETPQIKGMVFNVKHLVKVEEVEQIGSIEEVEEVKA